MKGDMKFLLKIGHGTHDTKAAPLSPSRLNEFVTEAVAIMFLVLKFLSCLALMDAIHPKMPHTVSAYSPAMVKSL